MVIFINHRFRWFCHGNETRIRLSRLDASQKRCGPDARAIGVRGSLPYLDYGSMHAFTHAGLESPARTAASIANATRHATACGRGGVAA